MKLDRDERKDAPGKYALVNLRKLTEVGLPYPAAPADVCRALRHAPTALEWGCVGDPDEFFVIKLRDACAPYALQAYADAMETLDPEFSKAVRDLAVRAELRLDSKMPD